MKSQPPRRLRIALIAHDGQKKDMREWAVWNKALLSRFEIFATHTTGELVVEATGLPVELLLSGRTAATRRSGR